MGTLYQIGGMIVANYKPIWILAHGERGGNAQVFATHQEAHDSAHARFMVWTATEGYDVEETDDPVTYFRTSTLGDVSYSSRGCTSPPPKEE